VFADVAAWMDGHMAGKQPFVVLCNAKRTTSGEFANADRRAVICSADQGFSTSILNRVRLILQTQRNLLG